MLFHQRRHGVGLTTPVRSYALLCLDGAAEARIRADFGSMCEQFTFQPADVRYATPGVAMAALNNFVDNAQQSGAAGAWSIGAIPLRADGRDARWLQYEEAVDEIFFNRPLRAVCLYDADSPSSRRSTDAPVPGRELDGLRSRQSVGFTALTFNMTAVAPPGISSGISPRLVT